jgi:hypothetical protein
VSVFAHVYPDILTKKDWDKNKGAFAKLAGKTGMGEQMEKLEKAWKSVKADNIDPDKVLYGAKGQDPDKVLALAKGEHAKCLAAQKEAYALRDLAKKTAEAFKKNKLIPKKSTEHVEAIQKTADHFGVALKLDLIGQFANEAKTALAEGEKFAALREAGAKELKALADKARMEIEAIEKNVSAGLSKLDDSMKREVAVKNLEDEALAPTGPVIRARGSLEKKYADLLDKLAPSVGGVLRKRAYDAFNAGMRDAALLRSMQLSAWSVIARQRLVGEKSTVPSYDANAAAKHVAALKEELDRLGSRATKPLTKVKADQWSAIKKMAEAAKTQPTAWTSYDAKKQETVEAFPFVAELIGYVATLKERVALLPDVDEPTKKAKADFLKSLDETAKDAADGLKQKDAFEKLAAECDKDHP